MEATKKIERLRGSLERVVWKSAKDDFTVARFRRADDGAIVSAVGEIGVIDAGETVDLEGVWVDDKRFGRQFRVRSFSIAPPATREGVVRYLASGIAKGLGPKLAEAIVDHLGLDAIDIISKDPKKIRKVPGVGKKKAMTIAGAIQARRAERDSMVFLYGLGLGPGIAGRILKTYGKTAAEIVQKDPYRLALEVSGVGFMTADAIARRMGVPLDSPERAAAGLFHTLVTAADDGHVFLPREELITKAAEALEIDVLIVERAVASLFERGFFVEEAGRIYSRALYDAEVELARDLDALASGRLPKSDVATGLLFERVERQIGLRLSDEQRRAAETALTARVVVLTGGPGTGKTTLVRALLEMLCSLGETVALAAPTGRAAKRLVETTGKDALTIHRLLQFDPKSGQFMRGVDDPLKLDALIVDESSMIDLPLANALVRALPAHARVIFVGDIDQLPPVGPGSPFRDIIASRAVPVVRLSTVFRQSGTGLIVENAHRVLHGERPRIPEANGPLTDFYFIERNEPAALCETIVELCATRIPRAFGLNAQTDIQVLSPMRRGDVGVEALNKALQQALNGGDAPGLRRGNETLRVRDRVMQTKNNYDLDVFNGDVGTVEWVDAAKGIATVNIDGRLVEFSKENIDDLTLAYAVSIHKSQGSEYPAVVVPLTTQHYIMLRRNLLYTAMTRGKRLVALVGSRRALDIAIRTDRADDRYSGLAERFGGTNVRKSG